MSGAPKLRTLEIIDRLEGRPRGVYSGALGFLSVNGTADLSIVIRTLVASPHGLTVGAGGAIVAGSDPEAELAEMRLKARALLDAVGGTLRARPAPGRHVIRPDPAGGVFETILVEHGRALHLEDHLARLRPASRSSTACRLRARAPPGSAGQAGPAACASRCGPPAGS